MEQPSDQELFNFPCDFPVKVMGKDDGQFEFLVVTSIRKHFPDFAEAAVSTRPSKGGKYLAVTVIVKATSREQLDNLYLELTGKDEVLWAL